MFTRATSFLIFIFILIVSPAVMAGDSIPTPPSQVTDLSGINVRMPEAEFIESYLNNKDYQYGRDYTLPIEESFFNRLWKKIISLWAMGLKTLDQFPFILQIALVVLCLLLLFVIITKTKLYKVFYTDTALPGPDYMVLDPLDENYDFNEAIGVQISKQNFRNAIRLLHLKIIKDLETQGIIRFSREKTNREYAREISDSNQKNTFFALAGIYNKVWFGNYNLSKDEFDSLASGFYQFSAEINGQKN